MKCDRCESEATIHITEIRRGISSDRHLCEACAQMLLPAEESDYAAFLDLLPPKDAMKPTAEGEPTKGEMSMTAFRQQVFLVDLSTGERRVAGPRVGNSWRPVWSPDSRRLAMCHGTEELPSLAIVEPGSSQVWHFLDTTFSEPPSWAPDSRRIAFSHEDDGAHIVAADLEGGGTLRVPEAEDANDFLPSWSPTDDRLAFLSMPATEPGEPGPCSVDVARPGTDERRRLLTMRRMLVGTGWSADARFLAAAAAEDAPESAMPSAPIHTLYVLPGEGDPSSKPARITGCLTAAWVPCAAGFAAGPAILAILAAGAAARTVLIEAATRARKTLADDLVFPAGLVRASHLSPDGRTLAALRGIGTLRIALLDIVTGDVREIDPRGEVAWLGWRENGSRTLDGVPDEIGRPIFSLAALIRDRAGVRLDLFSPDGTPRTVTVFERSEFFDAPLLAISPDGRLAAVELHAPSGK